MRNKEDYFFNADINSIQAIATSIYKKVFRTDFDEPGFVVIDLGEATSSENLRASMVKLKNELSKQHIAATGNYKNN